MNQCMPTIATDTSGSNVMSATVKPIGVLGVGFLVADVTSMPVAVTGLGEQDLLRQLSGVRAWGRGWRALMASAGLAECESLMPVEGTPRCMEFCTSSLAALAPWRGPLPSSVYVSPVVAVLPVQAVG